MLGAIVGDIVGSPYEYNNLKRKDFEFFSTNGFITDDSVLTLAVCHALCQQSTNLQKAAEKSLMEIAWRYADKDYGGGFRRWMQQESPTPYNSFGNGAAMRVSPCSIAAKTLHETKAMSYAVTSVTHNHPEGLKGAEAAAVAGFLAKNGLTKKAIEQYENRLTEVSVSMTYLKSQKLIQIVVEGRLVETNAPYKYTTSINLWN